MSSISALVKERQFSAAEKERLGFAIFFIFGLLLYLPFRSSQWDPNGISEAIGIRDGFLLHSNHILFRPLGLAVYSAVNALGFTVSLENVLLSMTITAAALSLGFAFAAYSRLTQSHSGAALGTLLLGISWAFWAYCTDINYIALTALGTSAALFILSNPRQSIWRLALAGALSACSVLFWQGNIFIFPALAYLIWLQNRDTPRQRIWFILFFLAIAGLIIAASYIAVGVSAFSVRSISTFLDWVGGYTTDAGGRPPIWGAWSLNRLLPMLVSLLSSFIPVWEGLGLRQLSEGIFQPEKFTGQLALLALGLVGLLTLLRWWKSRSTTPNHLIIWAGLSYLSFIPFIFWWDPFEPKWFILPNLMLLAGFSAIWRKTSARIMLAVLSLMILLIAAANFSMTIYPRHITPNANIKIAQCFANNTNDRDGVIIHRWSWINYARYFSNFQGKPIYLIKGAQRQADNVSLIQNELSQITARGGKLYISAWTKTEEADLREVQGLEVNKYFESYSLQPAFTCEGLDFLEITAKK